MERSSQSSLMAPKHLNSSDCRIEYTEGKGRGVFASRQIAAHTVIEISPVLLFTSSEYEEHGRHTVLHHYTFKWRDGRTALALGLGSLFNHSQSPNVSYTLDASTESIRYTTTRLIEPDEELCIFYGRKLWCDPVGSKPLENESEEEAEGWGCLSTLNEVLDVVLEIEDQIEAGNADDIISEDDLPFSRIKLIPEDEEEELSAIHTESAWVVDIPNPKQTTELLKWLKQSGLETPSMAHLKRIRKIDSRMSIILAFTSSSPDPPVLPEDADLPAPYLLDVPRTSALTMTSLKLKSSIWPTLYTPTRKGELEDWSRGKVKWAFEAMKHVVREARQASGRGELPIAAYVPVPYEEETRTASQVLSPFVAYDTRISTKHPLRHAILNLVRTVADRRASSSTSSETSSVTTPTLPTSPPDSRGTSSPAIVLSDANASDSVPQNGAHYLLTSLTLFVTHEPCIMCSMALLHSRVKEIYYLVPMSRTGGCGSAACIPILQGVNHRFGIGKWRVTLRWIQENGLEIDSGVDA